MHAFKPNNWDSQCHRKQLNCIISLRARHCFTEIFSISEWIRAWSEKQCCFKPHAVKVVYLFVTSDVTTHPCLGGGGAAPHVTSTGPDQAKPAWCVMSPTTTQDTRGSHLWLVIGGAGGKSRFLVALRGRGRTKKVMAIYLGSGQEIFLRAYV